MRSASGCTRHAVTAAVVRITFPLARCFTISVTTFPHILGKNSTGDQDLLYADLASTPCGHTGHAFNAINAAVKFISDSIVCSCTINAAIHSASDSSSFFLRYAGIDLTWTQTSDAVAVSINGTELGATRTG